MRCSWRFADTSIYMGLHAHLVRGCDSVEEDRAVSGITVCGGTGVCIFYLHAHGKVSVAAGHYPAHGQAQSTALTGLDRPLILSWNELKNT